MFKKTNTSLESKRTEAAEMCGKEGAKDSCTLLKDKTGLPKISLAGSSEM